MPRGQRAGVLSNAPVLAAALLSVLVASWVRVVAADDTGPTPATVPAGHTQGTVPHMAAGTTSASDSQDDHRSTAEKIIDALGGGGPGGQTAIRGFFIGIAVGIVVALLLCCWWPCLRMTKQQRRELVALTTRSGRRRRRERRAAERGENEAGTAGTEMSAVGGDQGEHAPAETYRDEVDGGGEAADADADADADGGDADYEARRESTRLQQGESYRDGERHERRLQATQSQTQAQAPQS